MTRTETEIEVPSVVRIAGPSDAGKTTLVERLLEAFDGELTVATVKSIHHDIEPDTAGTDTHRHRTAGAASVVGITPSFAFEVSPIGDSANATESDPTDSDAAKRAALHATLRRFADRGYDLVLIEGFSGTDLPTVWLGDGDGSTVAGEVIATGSDAFEEILAAVRAAGPPPTVDVAAADEE
ncbi:molybdopterin-guanine dinucleotide biosynthesis protein B [Halorubrum sp. DTA98]|uniref:molybdopterin-guanine dinucleotide biosynthesis protein B n=1 Tax=Halorubrum sp. DTA98 TaxID=3402163 RepID=UPI003AB09921